MLATPDSTTTIVVGVDGSPRSEDAVSFAGRLAAAVPTRITLVCVYPHAPLETAYGSAAIDEVQRRQADATLARVRALLPADLAVSTITVADPSPARALHEVATREGASLVVLGSSHVGRVGRITPGSTGERLLQGAPCAVVIVPSGLHDQPDGPLAPIGVGFDGSPEARVALRAAAEAARALGAELRVITVAHAGHYPAPALQYGPGYYVAADDLLDNARDALQAAVAELPGDLRVTPILRAGPPAHELAAGSSELAILYVGSRGYGPLRAVLLGGVGGALIRDAECPVLVTPRGASVDSAATTAAAAAAR